MMPIFEGPRSYRVLRADREPLLTFMLNALRSQGCRIIHSSEPDHAPFVVTFETRSGERMGIVAYAFLATRTPTRNRPSDERSFQVKYGSKLANNTHQIWQDPWGLFTTLLVGISLEEGHFVAVDPEMHNPTKFFIRIEYKDKHADEIRRKGWTAWERSRVGRQDEDVEVMVGGTAEHFLDFVRFERAAQGLDPGNRHLLAQRLELFTGTPTFARDDALVQEVAHHPLAQELKLNPDEVLDVIAGARRLKMAVRGWVAERHLKDTLSKIAGVVRCERVDDEGSPDLRLQLSGGPLLTVECKNVLRETDKNGLARLDFQRTRASKKDPCSRYYSPSDFDVVAACLHAVTEKWEFRYILPQQLPSHITCRGKLANNLRINEIWQSDALAVFRAAANVRL